jgi:hypothetical protein
MTTQTQVVLGVEEYSKTPSTSFPPTITEIVFESVTDSSTLLRAFSALISRTLFENTPFIKDIFEVPTILSAASAP